MYKFCTADNLKCARINFAPNLLREESYQQEHIRYSLGSQSGFDEINNNLYVSVFMLISLMSNHRSDR